MQESAGPLPEQAIRKSLRIAELVILQFVAAVLISVGFHRSQFQPQSEFLSVLGTQKHPMPWIFNGAVFSLGAGLLWFFVTLATISSRERFGLRKCCGWGIVSAVALLVVGFCPWDRWPLLHTLAFLVWILCLVPMSDEWWCWTCSWYSSSVRCWLINKMVLIVAIAYVPLGMFGAGAFWQKIVVFTSFCWVGYFVMQLHWLVAHRQLFRVQLDSSSELYDELDFHSRKP